MFMCTSVTVCLSTHHVPWHCVLLTVLQTTDQQCNSQHRPDSRYFSTSSQTMWQCDARLLQQTAHMSPPNRFNRPSRLGKVKLCKLFSHVKCLRWPHNAVSRATCCWEEYLGLRGTRLQGNGENYIMRSFMMCTADPMLFGWSNWETDGRGM